MLNNGAENSRDQNRRGHGSNPLRDISAPSATSEPFAVLRELVHYDSPLSDLARKLLTTTVPEQLSLLKSPITASGLLPLYYILTNKGQRECGALPNVLRKALPMTLVKLGADPFARGPRERAAVLTPRYLDNIENVRYLVRYHSAELSGTALSNGEKAWLYIECYKTCSFHQEAVLADRLMGLLFSDRKISHSGARGFRDPGLHLRDGVHSNQRLIHALSRLTDEGVLSRDEVRTMLNKRYNRDGELFIHRVLKNPDEVELLMTLALELGASLDGQMHDRSVSPGTSGWHMVAASPQYLERNSNTTTGCARDMAIQDHRGDTPLHVYLRKAPNPKPDLLEFFIGEGTALRCCNVDEEFPLDVALKRDRHAVVLNLRMREAPVGDDPTLRAKLAFIEENEDFFRNGRNMAITAALKGFNSLESGERELFAYALTRSRGKVGLQRAPRRTALERLAKNAPETELARLTPSLLLAPTAGPIRHLANVIDGQAIETFSASQGNAPKFDPNEAEALAMLARPGLLAAGGEDLHAVVFGVTSMRRFDIAGVQHLDDEVLHLWANIGSAGFEFLNLKFDARTFLGPQGAPTTLLEQYGFRRVTPNQTRYQTTLVNLGLAQPPQPTPVFLLKGLEKGDVIRFDRIQASSGAVTRTTRLDPGTEIELGRSFNRFYHPTHGELIIRNSAPDGGRNVLLHPAYFISPANRIRFSGVDSPPGLEKRWDPREIEQLFDDVLTIALYPEGKLGFEMQSAQFLLGQYRTFVNHYRSWLCDMSEHTAYLNDPDSGQRYLVGAYRSDGFKTLLGAVSHWTSEDIPLELAFCRRDFPAWDEYHRITVTPRVITELRKLAAGDFSSRTLRSSGVHAFMQAGLNSFGHLIIRSANTGGAHL